MMPDIPKAGDPGLITGKGKKVRETLWQHTMRLLWSGSWQG